MTPVTPTTETGTATAMPAGISLGLTRIHRLLSALRSPHLATPVVHIAGTNGKGSVSAYLASILQHGAGIPTARFNSPHLVDEWDCIHLHGRPVDEQTFRAAKARVQLASDKDRVGATSFEVLTATAFTLFAAANPPVRVAVVEVGMGGAEDATNVVPAEQTLLSVVTAVDLDHQKFLGETVAEIARVKAGIIRPDGDAVVGVQAHPEARAEIEQVAQERHARLYHAGQATPLPADAPSRDDDALPPAPLVSIPLEPTRASTPDALGPTTASWGPPLRARLPLPGSYQLENAATAVLCASLLRSLPRTRRLVPALDGSVLTNEAIREGVEATQWPGRLSWLSLPATPDPASSARQPPPVRVLLDGAHNPSSATLLASYLASLPPHLAPSTLIFALSAPRDPAEVIRPLLQALMPTRLGSPRSGPAESPQRSKRRRVRVVCCGFSTPVGMDWVRATAPAELASRVRHEVTALLEATEAEAEVEVEVLVAENAEQALALAQARAPIEEEAGNGTGTTMEDPPPQSPRRPTVVVAGSLYLVADVMRLTRASDARLASQ
ncbi:hypothetical protein JCM3774_005185 [Rhodotorula dairenensis]